MGVKLILTKMKLKILNTAFHPKLANETNRLDLFKNEESIFQFQEFINLLSNTDYAQ